MQWGYICRGTDKPNTPANVRLLGCRHVLELLVGQVYANDALARELQLSLDERLLFHQQHSAPLMTALREACQEGSILQENGQYRLPFDTTSSPRVAPW